MLSFRNLSKSLHKLGGGVALCALAFGTMASAIAGVVPTPTVTGPLASDPRGSASRNYTFFATDLDLKSRGYVEEEFFISGTANRYDAANPGGGIGADPNPFPTANILSSGHPYKTRIVVRRPGKEKKFNGTVIVEWTNVTSGYDVEALWFRTHEFMIRDGYAWIGVSAQTNGITGATNGLKVWSPNRYGTLDVIAKDPVTGAALTGDPLSYDIYAQAIQAARSVPEVLGRLKVRHVIAAGVSQSAGRLGVYVNAIHPRDPIVDAVLLYIGGQKIREDLDIPVLKLLTETEHSTQANELPALQPDTDKIRVWAMAGTSHSDWPSFAVRYAILRRDTPALPLADNCLNPSRSRIQDRYVIGAAIDALAKWVKKGTEPAHSPALVIKSFTPPEVERDAYGNALGGIRLASFEVPVAVDQGPNFNKPGVGGLCFLNGTHIPFDTATLNTLYPTHDEYVSAIKEAAKKNVQDGFLLDADAKELIDTASNSIYGYGLTCGPLCANVAQFPLNPSTSLLRDHTNYYYFVGNNKLLGMMDTATWWVAKGYTYAEQPDAQSQQKSKESFTYAIEALQLYIEQVRRTEAKGLAAPESAALLMDYANILITQLQPLAAP